MLSIKWNKDNRKKRYEYYLANKEQSKKADKLRRSQPAYKESRSMRNKERRLNDEEFRQMQNDRNNDWRKNNLAYCAHKSQLHRTSKLKAAPEWADKELMKDMYMEAKYHKMEVDHIVPLKSKMVCGLHWEGNLQLLSANSNRAKSNSYWEGMWE